MDRTAVTRKKVGGQRGASGVSVYNLGENPVTVSVRIVEKTGSEEKDWFDETIQLTSPEARRLEINLPRESEYRISVAVDGGGSEDAKWTPTNEEGGGLHIIYDGTDENIVFASGIE